MKKMTEGITNIVNDALRKFCYTQLEGYFDIAIYKYLFGEGINHGYVGDEGNITIIYQTSNIDFNVYIDDKDLLDEDGFYDDVCELAHIHIEDILYVLYHMDTEMEYIKERINKYIEYKNKNQ